MANELTPQEIRKVALLGRLKLTDAELADFTSKLGKVLGYVELLNEIDTDDVEPMVHAVELRNIFRPDEAVPSLSREDALSNAPKTDGRFFLVPQILDGA